MAVNGRSAGRPDRTFGRSETAFIAPAQSGFTLGRRGIFEGRGGEVMFACFGKGSTSASSAFCETVIGNLIGHGSLGSLLLIDGILQKFQTRFMAWHQFFEIPPSTPA